jgi:steroid delta-isomerase-like uncharacterized protein
MRFAQDGFLAAWSSAWSCRDPEQLLPFYAADARYRDVGSDTTYLGHAELTRFYRFMLRFAPDSTVEFDSAYGDGQGFAAHWTWSGTAMEPLRVGDELFPTHGKPFSVPGVAYCTLTADGLLASHDDYYDMYAVIRQIRP